MEMQVQNHRERGREGGERKGGERKGGERERTFPLLRLNSFAYRPAHIHFAFFE